MSVRALTVLASIITTTVLTLPAAASPRSLPIRSVSAPRTVEVSVASQKQQKQLSSLSHTIASLQTAAWSCQDSLHIHRTEASVAPWALPASVPYRMWVKGHWKAQEASCAQTGKQRKAEAARIARATPQDVICQVFGSYCREALAVARCESGYSVNAQNGQYVNLFQMGYHERQTYGWHVAGSPAIVATQAAYRYFVASGRDWSPWSCGP